MKRIKKYNKFVSENKFIVSNKKNLFIFSDIYLNNNTTTDEELGIKILEKLYKDLSYNDKLKVSNFMDTTKFNLSDIINESFWDKFSKRIDKATEVSNILPNDTESILKKLIRRAGEAMNFIKKILDSIKEWVSNIITEVKSKVVNKLKKDEKFISSVKKVIDKDDNGFIKDLNVSKDVYLFYKKDLLGNLLNSFKNGFGNFFKNEQTPIPENFVYINEGGNVLSTFIHGIEKIPPFSWLHKAAKVGESGANKIIESLSWVTDKLGGDKFTLPTIGVLLGIAFEYNIKGSVKSGIISILGDSFTGGLLSVISWIATIIAAIIVIDEISGKKILGTHT